MVGSYLRPTVASAMAYWPSVRLAISRHPLSRLVSPRHRSTSRSTEPREPSGQSRQPQRLTQTRPAASLRGHLAGYLHTTYRSPDRAPLGNATFDQQRLWLSTGLLVWEGCHKLAAGGVYLQTSHPPKASYILHNVDFGSIPIPVTLDNEG